jgi:hypothetical protein
MRYVVLDTTALYGSPLLDDAYGRLLLKKSRSGDVTLAVPSVVLREASRHFAERVGQSIKNQRAAQSSLMDLGYSTREELAPLPSAQRLGQFYEERLRARLLESKGEILPLPNVAHDILIDHLFASRKPFKRKGDGYRDALIWHTVLGLVSSGAEVVFVTNNTDDFVTPGLTPPRLHKDLLEDLASVGASESRVEVRLAIKHVVSEITTREETVVEEVRERLVRDGGFKAELLRGIEERLQLEYPAGASAPVADEEAYPFENLTLSFLGDISEVDVADARSIDDQTLYVFFDVIAQASIDAYLFKSDLYSMDPDDDNYSMLDYDWNDHYASVGLVRRVDVSVETLYDTAAKSLSEVHLGEVTLQVH